MRARPLISSIRLLALCSVTALAAACAAPVEDVESEEAAVAAAEQAFNFPPIGPAQVAQVRAAFLQASAASPAVRQAFAAQVDITFRQGTPMGCTAGRVAYALPVRKLLSHPSVYPAILAQGVSKATLDGVIDHPGVRPIRLTLRGSGITQLHEIIEVSNPRGYDTLSVLLNHAPACHADAALAVHAMMEDFYTMTAASMGWSGVCADDFCTAMSEMCPYMNGMPGNAVNECRDLASDCHQTVEDVSATWEAIVDAANTVSEWAEGAWAWAEDTLDPDGDPDGDGYPNSEDSDNHNRDAHITPESEAGIPMIVDKWMTRGYVWQSSPLETCASMIDYNNVMVLASPRRVRMFSY